MEIDGGSNVGVGYERDLDVGVGFEGDSDVGGLESRRFKYGWLGVEAGVYALKKALDTTLILRVTRCWVGKGARYLYVILFAKNNATGDDVYRVLEGTRGVGDPR